MQKITPEMLLALAIGFWPVCADAGPLPDPTRPANTFTPTIINEDLPRQVTNWRLTAIRISDRGRTAIINGRIMKAGDEMGNGTLLEITPKSVLLDYDGKQLVVSLVPYTVKKLLAKRRE